MESISTNVAATPRGVVEMLVEELGGGDIAVFMEHLANFALPIASALSSGAKIATGDAFMGYREIEITLFAPIEDPFPGLNISFKFVHTIFDVPTRQKLAHLERLMCATSYGEMLNRALYWLWVATQLASIERKLFIMDHARGRWDSCVYKPLWDARFSYRY
jgi:hypothetical protein